MRGKKANKDNFSWSVSEWLVENELKSCRVLLPCAGVRVVDLT